MKRRKVGRGGEDVKRAKKSGGGERKGSNGRGRDKKEDLVSFKVG